MAQFLVLTVIGDDRPGLVEEISTLLTRHGASWLDSSMARLAGKFAGVLTVSVAEADAAALRDALGTLHSLRVGVELGAAPGAAPGYTRRLSFKLVGHDRIGIVREVSQVFARHKVNVEKLVTWTSSAPMSAETLFHAEAELLTTDGCEAAQLKADLEALSNELIADIGLDEKPR